MRDGRQLTELLRDRHTLGQRVKNLFWRAAYSRWPAVEEVTPGYTLVLPVPADLPVFLYLGLATAAHQDPAGRVETIVVPDQMTPEFGAAFENARREFDVGPIRLVPVGRRSRLFRRIARNDPSKNYFLQIHAGTAAARTSHALLHDADLFIRDPGFLARHYRRCAEEKLACLGVSPCWDDWLREHGFDHVVATWELLVDLGWLRSFPPWKHRGHHAWLAGEWHGFDVTLYPQALTAPELCGLHDAGDGFEHFNWVICSYRHFHGGTERPYEDDRFVLLLIRLLADSLRPGDGAISRSADLPSVELLARGISDPAQPVTYRSEDARSYYPDFRRKVDRMLASPVFGDATADQIRSALQPFDLAFADSAAVSMAGGEQR